MSAVYLGSVAVETAARIAADVLEQDAATAATDAEVAALLSPITTTLSAVEARSALSITQAQQYRTTTDQASLMASVTPPPFAGRAPGYQPIVVSPSEQGQPIIGFGAALTDSAAYCLTSLLSSAQRATLLAELFSPTQANLSTVRIGFGRTDFQQSSAYTYDDMPSAGMTDPGLVNFSVVRDAARIIPTLQEILAINPRLRIIASVWNPPGWMCDTGNHLSSANHTVFATYLVKAVQAYATYGLPIYATTTVNEPSQNGYTAVEVADIGAKVGAAFVAAGLSTKVWAGDDNWNVATAYQDALMADAAASPYYDGFAWHGYAGTPCSAGALLTKYPSRSQHLVEMRTLLSQDWATSMQIIAGYVAIGSLRNGARSVTLWNMALDEAGLPNAGTTGRRGFITIPSSGSGVFVRNAEYYVLRHLAQFLQAGAVKVSSSSYGGYSSSYTTAWLAGYAGTAIESVAYLNPDGSVVLLAFNPTASAVTTVIMDARTGTGFPVTLAAGELSTFVWGTTRQSSPAGTPVTLTAPPARVLSASGQAGQVVLSWTMPATSPPVDRLVLNKGASTGAETALVTLPPTDTTYTDLIAAGGTAFYTITAVSAAGSTVSNEVTATATARTAPPAPTFTSVTPGNAQVTLAFAAVQTPAVTVTLTVRRSTTSGAETDLIVLPSNATSYVDTTVVNDTTYFYTVRAGNSTGNATSAELSTTPTTPAAPSIDALAQNVGANTGTTSWTHTVGNVGNRMLLVAVHNSGSGLTTNLPTSVTFGGVAMTQVPGSQVFSNSATARGVTLFYLVAPAVGAGTVLVSWNNTNQNWVCESISLKHVAQTSTFGTAATLATASGTSLSVNTTGAGVLDTVFSAVTIRTATNTPTGGGGQTQAYSGTPGATTVAAGDTQAGPVGTVASSYSWSVADNAALVAVPIHGA
jgi:glucosylceramidase